MSLSSKFVTDQMVFLKESAQSSDLRTLVQKFGLSNDEAEVVVYLYLEGPSTLLDIGFDLKNPDVNKTITLLKSKGLIWIEGEE